MIPINYDYTNGQELYLLRWGKVLHYYKITVIQLRSNYIGYMRKGRSKPRIKTFAREKPKDFYLTKIDLLKAVKGKMSKTLRVSAQLQDEVARSIINSPEEWI